MIKNKLRPRIMNAAPDAGPHNYFYRLVSSQRFLVIIGLVFLLAIIFPIAQTYSQRLLVEKEIADTQSQIKDYETQNQQLQSLLAYLQSDQSLEEQARLNLNMKKPGEGVIVVENQAVNQNETGTGSAPDNRSNLQKWWRYFFN
jgi:cell division protein FtsB